MTVYLLMKYVQYESGECLGVFSRREYAEKIKTEVAEESCRQSAGLALSGQSQTSLSGMGPMTASRSRGPGVAPGRRLVLAAIQPVPLTR